MNNNKTVARFILYSVIDSVQCGVVWCGAVRCYSVFNSPIFNWSNLVAYTQTLSHSRSRSHCHRYNSYATHETVLSVVRSSFKPATTTTKQNQVYFLKNPFHSISVVVFIFLNHFASIYFSSSSSFSLHFVRSHLLTKSFRRNLSQSARCRAFRYEYFPCLYVLSTHLSKSYELQLLKIFIFYSFFIFSFLFLF